MAYSPIGISTIQSLSGPPLPGGRQSQSQPEWMDPSPPYLDRRHLRWRIPRRTNL